MLGLGRPARTLERGAEEDGENDGERPNNEQEPSRGEWERAPGSIRCPDVGAEENGEHKTVQHTADCHRGSVFPKRPEEPQHRDDHDDHREREPQPKPRDHVSTLVVVRRNEHGGLTGVEAVVRMMSGRVGNEGCCKEQEREHDRRCEQPTNAVR